MDLLIHLAFRCSDGCKNKGGMLLITVFILS